MSDTRIAPYVLQPGAGRSLDLGAFRMYVKAGAEETAGQFSLLEAPEPSGFGPPLHIHRDAAEASYVLEGEYIASRKLNLYTPAAMVGYFDELAAASERDDLDPAGLADIAQRYSMEVIGPVAEGYL